MPIVFLLLIFCLPASAGTEGRAQANSQGFQLYRFPRISAPANWIADENMSQQYGMLALAPAGKSFASSTSVMYARAIYFPKRVFSLGQHVEGDIADFKKRDPKAITKTHPPLMDRDKNAWQIVDFAYTDGTTTNHETVAYLAEGDYIFHLALSSRAEKEFVNFRPAFIQWVMNYRNLPDGAETSKTDQEKASK